MCRKIDCYIDAFSNLHAPGIDKSLLLFTVLDLISAKKINREFIEPSPELTEAYTNHWQRLMENGSSADLARPFYDMNVEPFWELAPRHGATLPDGEKCTMEKLQKFYLGARIDHELFKLCLMEPLRRKLQKTLIATYFEQQALKFLKE